MSRLLIRQGRFFSPFVWLSIVVCLGASLLNVALAWMPSTLARDQALLNKLFLESPLCLAQHTSGQTSAGEQPVSTASVQQQASDISINVEPAESSHSGKSHCDACLFTLAMLHVTPYAAQAPPGVHDHNAVVAVAFHPLLPRFSLPMSQAPPDFPPIV